MVGVHGWVWPDIPASVYVLLLSRNSFEPDAQLMALFRIVNDPTQTLNTKVKLAYLEYLLELLPMLEPGHFKETQGQTDRYVGSPHSHTHLLSLPQIPEGQCVKW